MHYIVVRSNPNCRNASSKCIKKMDKNSLKKIPKNGQQTWPIVGKKIIFKLQKLKNIEQKQKVMSGGLK
jgi:hypothetical protein